MYVKIVTHNSPDRAKGLNGAAGITDCAIEFMAVHMFCVEAGGNSGRFGNMPNGGLAAATSGFADW